VEHLRLVMAEVQVATVRAQVMLSLFHDFVQAERAPREGAGAGVRPGHYVGPGPAAPAGAVKPLP